MNRVYLEIENIIIPFQLQLQVVGVDKLCKRVGKLGAQALEQDREEGQAFQN